MTRILVGLLLGTTLVGCGDNIHLRDGGPTDGGPIDGGPIPRDGRIPDGGPIADANPNAADANPNAADANPNAADANPNAADANPNAADANPNAADANPNAADANPNAADANPNAADANPNAADANPNAADANPNAADANPNAADANPNAADANPNAADANPNAADAAGPIASTVIISEVVATPLHDWSGATPAFAGTPGGGAINPSDQWIELANVGADPVDLTSWTLSLIDTGHDVSTLGVDGVLAFSAGSTLSALLPGGFVVLGNPAGSISPDVFIELRRADDVLIDDVEIGGLSPSRDMEGDGVGDGAPSMTSNGFARGAFEQAVARLPGAADTDVDADDFDARYATPTRANDAPVVPPENMAPVALSGPSGAGFRINRALRVQFSEPILAASADIPGNVMVFADGNPVPLGFHTFSSDDTALVINPIGVLPFDADLSVVVLGGAGGVTDLVGNPLPITVSFNAHTEVAPAPASSIRINEVCATPQQDWNDSAGGNLLPFDDVPGAGTVDSNDEWIELLVQLPGPLTLDDYVLEFYHGPTLLQDARGTSILTAANTRVFGVGADLNEVVLGDRVVLGNPAGSLGFALMVILRDAGGAIVDTVELGGNTVDSDRGGDGTSNGAPGPGLDARSTSLADEVVARVPDGLDTGSDTGDFAHATATLGAAN